MNFDTNTRDQALKAYRSVLDNFFGSVTVFERCPAQSPDSTTPLAFSVPLNELVADSLYRPERTGFEKLYEGGPRVALEILLEWGYSYQPATPPLYDDGVISVNGG